MTSMNTATAHRTGQPSCPPWCVEDWTDLDPGTAYHHGTTRIAGANAAQVSVERFDDGTLGESRVRLTVGIDDTVSPREARILAAALLDAADEAETSNTSAGKDGQR